MKNRNTTSLDPWGPISALLYTIGDIEDVLRIVSLAGLSIEIDLSKEEKFSHKTRIRAYSQRISETYENLEEGHKFIFILNVARELINEEPELVDTSNRILNRIGWFFIGDKLVKYDLINPSDIQNLPESSIEDISKAAERLPNDLSGAITSACSAVDAITSKIYAEYDIGKFGEASFQKKVSNSLSALNITGNLKEELIDLGWEEKKADEFSHIFKKAILNYLKVLEILRSNMGDVHGTKPVLQKLAFSALNWSMTINPFLKNI